MNTNLITIHQKNRNLFGSYGKRAFAVAGLPWEAPHEVFPSYTYPLEYQEKGEKPKVKPIEEQIITLATRLKLNPDSALHSAKNLPKELPQGAEGWFAVYLASNLPSLFPTVGDLADKYCRAVELVFDKITLPGRPFCNTRQGQMSKDHLRITPHTSRAMDQIIQAQKGDIQIIPAQLGMLHRGQSTSVVRENYSSTEFGFELLGLLSIFITHPERFAYFHELLNPECPGNDFITFGDSFYNVPIIYFDETLVTFDLKRADSALPYFGPITGFVPVNKI